MFYPTLNSALIARDPALLELWPIDFYVPYGHTAMVVESGVYISVYRDERGLYEEAISYESKCENFRKLVRTSFTM